MADQDHTTDNPGSTNAASERIEKGAERFKEAVDHAADHVQHGTDKAATAAEYAAEHGADMYGNVKDYAGDWMDDARVFVRKRPMESLAMAIAAGWLVGRLMHR